MTFAKESLPFVLPLAVAALVLLLLRQTTWAVALGGIAVLVLLFFRIPSRKSSG